MSHHIDGPVLGGIGATVTTIVSWLVNGIGWVETHNVFIASIISSTMTIGTLLYWHALFRLKCRADRREQRESDARIASMEGGRREEDVGR